MLLCSDGEIKLYIIIIIIILCSWITGVIRISIHTPLLLLHIPNVMKSNVPVSSFLQRIVKSPSTKRQGAYALHVLSLYYSRLHVGLAIAKTVMFHSCYLFFFRKQIFPPIFAKLCHATRYVLKLIMSYGVFIRGP